MVNEQVVGDYWQRRNLSLKCRILARSLNNAHKSCGRFPRAQCDSTGGGVCVVCSKSQQVVSARWSRDPCRHVRSRANSQPDEQSKLQQQPAAAAAAALARTNNGGVCFVHAMDRMHSTLSVFSRRLAVLCTVGIGCTTDSSLESTAFAAAANFSVRVANRHLFVCSLCRGC
jgi:hypothetical protein